MVSNIDKMMPSNGRHIREDTSLINLADVLFYAYGFEWSVANNRAGVISADVSAQAGEIVALNLNFDKTVMIAKIKVSEDGIQPVLRTGFATGEYGQITLSRGLDFTADSFDDNSQAQVINNATSSGTALANGSIQNGVKADGESQLHVEFDNSAGQAITETVLVTFFKLDDISTKTPLEPATQLETNTEMGNYG